MTDVFHRQPLIPLPTAVGGKGVYIEDSNGKQYLDASGGAAVSCLGHGDPDIIDAIKSQADKISFAHTGFFTSEPAELLADVLIEKSPNNIGKVFFCSGGSEATESAVKLAYQYHLERGEPERRHIIARRLSFHGNTLGALAVGGNQWRRKQFEPLLIDVSHIAPCFAYREQSASENEEEYGLRAANELEREIIRLGSETVGMFIAETVVGATAGAVPPVRGYFKRIREICDRYGVLLILDEVMCGIGRTGTFFACEQEEIEPDIITIAKGLGAGYQALGAMLASREIYQTLIDGSGFFQHSHTFMGHPIACAVGLAVVKAIEDRELLTKVKEEGAYLFKRLNENFKHHPNIGDIRGRGMLCGLELVQDRESKKTFDPRLKLHAAVKKAAIDRGLICYPMAGTVDGINGDHILLAPPYIVEQPEIDLMVERLDDAIDMALMSVFR